MRDPERIRPFLEKLAELWEQHPDYRFGQLIMNLTRPGGGKPGFLDPWEWEEEHWERLIAEYDTHLRGYQGPVG